MKRKDTLSGSLLLALAVLAIPGSDALAQRTQRGGHADMAATALRLADELELSDGQRSSLESLRLEMLEERQARVSTLMALRSDIAAGTREREAMRAEMRDAREMQREKRDSWRTRFQEILTDEQKETLKELRPEQRRRPAVGRRGNAGRRGAAMRRRDARGSRAWRRDARPMRRDLEPGPAGR